MVLRAPLFVDATGDALIADRAGCGWRMGIEGKAETGEPHAPAEASTSTMGNSIYIRAKNDRSGEGRGWGGACTCI